MDIFIGVIVGLLVLMFLVTIHEFGHFVAARRNGVNVLEFGIGFPPRAVAWIKDPKTGKWRRLKRKEWDKDKVTKVVGASNKNTVSASKEDSKKASKKLFQKGMIFSLNWLPIGGFCQMDGESASDTRSGTFGKANFLAKTKILFAGVAMNWLVAFVIFTILAWTGMPQFMDNQFKVANDARVDVGMVEITSVLEGSPADEAGMQVGDYILEVNSEKVHYTVDVMDINEEHHGEEVTYKMSRPVREEGAEPRNEEYTVTIQLNPAEAEYLLGVTMTSSQTLVYSTWSAPIVGAGLTLQFTGETLHGVGTLIGNLITGAARLFSPDEGTRESGQEALSEVKNSVSGPVGIIGQLFPSFTAAGPTNLAYLTAVISVSLACMNVLPIPALDGGRWLLIAIYKIRRKKLSKETEERIVSRAMMVLLALIFIVTILDIIRIAQQNG